MLICIDDLLLLVFELFLGDYAVFHQLSQIIKAGPILWGIIGLLPYQWDFVFMVFHRGADDL